MKNLSLVFLLIFFLGFITSCKKESNQKTYESTLEVDGTLQKDGILVFLDPSYFQMNLDELSPEEKKRAESIVEKLGDEEFLGLKILKENIHISNLPWFFVESVTVRQYDNLVKLQEAGKLEVLWNKTLELQGRKPMMQGDTILQGRKPQMQEEWRYDAAAYTSEFIKWIGGGMAGGSVPSGRTVWIIDSGIDAMHQDLNGVLNTSIGYPENNVPEAYTDQNGHGTMIAGIIGAVAFNQTNQNGNPNDIGMNGIFPGAKMVSLKIIDEKGNSNMNKLSKAIDYLLAGKAQAGDVVNISLGTNDNNCNHGQLDEKILQLANRGVYIVFSAGNDTSENISNFPSCLADGNFMISVGSMNLFCSPPNEVLLFSSFSNYGTMTSSTPIWVAPGEQIFSTMPTNPNSRGVYGIASGTSYSAAFMSGILYSRGVLPPGNQKLFRGADPTEYPIAKLD